MWSDIKVKKIEQRITDKSKDKHLEKQTDISGFCVCKNQKKEKKMQKNQRNSQSTGTGELY